jgi:hypothetical protein
MADENGTGTEGQGGGGAPAGSGGGAAGALAAPPAAGGDGGQGGGGQGGGAAASWLDALPDDLKADATLSRFKSIDELARGHIEAHKVAKSKVPMPGESEESFNAFAAAIRPETPDAYKIEVPEGQPTEYAETMRGVFHQAGLHPKQVEMIVAANNAQAEALAKKADEAVQAFQAERGAAYAQELGQVQAFMKKLGIDEATVTNAEKALGSNNLMTFMWKLAEMTGEMQRVDGDPAMDANIAGLSLEQAEAKMTELNKSAEHRGKIKANDPAALALHNQLVSRIAQLRGQRRA